MAELMKKVHRAVPRINLTKKIVLASRVNPGMERPQRISLVVRELSLARTSY